MIDPETLGKRVEMLDPACVEAVARLTPRAKLDDASFAQIKVAPDAPVVGLRIREMDWPDESLVVSVRREGKLHVARSDTTLQAKDQVTVFANRDCLPILRQYLSGSRPGATPGL